MVHFCGWIRPDFLIIYRSNIYKANYNLCGESQKLFMGRVLGQPTGLVGGRVGPGGRDTGVVSGTICWAILSVFWSFSMIVVIFVNVCAFFTFVAIFDNF